MFKKSGKIDLKIQTKRLQQYANSLSLYPTKKYKKAGRNEATMFKNSVRKFRKQCVKIQSELRQQCVKMKSEVRKQCVKIQSEI